METIKQERIEMLRKRFKPNKAKSVNDVISEIYADDVARGRHRNSWRFYVHLNKYPAEMERRGLIKHVGEKMGEYRKEKMWIRV